MFQSRSIEIKYFEKKFKLLDKSNQIAWAWLDLTWKLKYWKCLIWLDLKLKIFGLDLVWKSYKWKSLAWWGLKFKYLKNIWAWNFDFQKSLTWLDLDKIRLDPSLDAEAWSWTSWNKSTTRLQPLLLGPFLYFCEYIVQSLKFSQCLIQFWYLFMKVFRWNVNSFFEVVSSLSWFSSRAITFKPFVVFEESFPILLVFSLPCSKFSHFSNFKIAIAYLKHCM